ncbi:hypothetical protein ACBY01_10345 [Sphingomonas sp. ac-8]|uniref:hypothetical protein n=1 Tax=Sphingomonas sp. ac-8 TaxID=3242977 RepID=UPI003A81305D
MPIAGFMSAGAALAMVLFGSGTAAAQEAPAPAAFAAPVVSEDALGTITGREDVQQHATATQNAGVAHNSVGDNARTGDASVAGKAFQNLSGLSIVNVNTGNNVAINAAMTVNIALAPQP